MEAPALSAELRKLKSGDPLKIPAATFNAFVDAAAEQLSGL